MSKNSCEVVDKILKWLSMDFCQECNTLMRKNSGISVPCLTYKDGKPILIKNVYHKSCFYIKHSLR